MAQYKSLYFSTYDATLIKNVISIAASFGYASPNLQILNSSQWIVIDANLKTISISSVEPSNGNNIKLNSLGDLVYNINNLSFLQNTTTLYPTSYWITHDFDSEIQRICNTTPKCCPSQIIMTWDIDLHTWDINVDTWNNRVYL